MKKVKITILKTTLQEDLAKEYGVDNLSTCPMMKEGELTMLITPNLKDSVMKYGRQYTSMYLPLLME